MPHHAVLRPLAREQSFVLTDHPDSRPKGPRPLGCRIRRKLDTRPLYLAEPMRVMDPPQVSGRCRLPDRPMAPPVPIHRAQRIPLDRTWRGARKPGARQRDAAGTLLRPDRAFCPAVFGRTRYPGVYGQHPPAHHKLPAALTSRFVICSWWTHRSLHGAASVSPAPMSPLTTTNPSPGASPTTDWTLSAASG